MRFRTFLVPAALAGALVLGSLPVVAAPVTLAIDPEHSHVGFSVRHLFTRVQGRFGEFSGSVVFDEANPSASSVRATIIAASVDTNVEARDKDLRSPRFFDVAKHPHLTFESRSVKKGSGSKFEILGTLTMHGVSKEVALDAEFLGKGKDPWGNERYAFHAETAVNRKEFGMTWNEVVEAGGVLVGDEVRIVLDVEAVPGE